MAAPIEERESVAGTNRTRNVSLTFLAILLVARVASATPTLTLEPTELAPGEPLLVTVQGAETAPEGELAGRPLRFWKQATGWRAIAALPVEEKPGTTEVRVKIAGRSDPVVAALVVRAPTWRDRELKVAPTFTEPAPDTKRRQEADKKAFERAFARPFAPPMFSGPFGSPRNDVVTAVFGDRRMFNGKVESQHYGLDLDGKVGAPIVAAHDGVVVMVRNNFFAGRTVVVDHGANLFTTYFHMSKTHVREGQRVKRGEKLGAVGKTGRVTGPHLHFGVRIDGLYVDPQAMLKLDVTR